MYGIETAMEKALRQGLRVYVVIEDDFYKATLSGPDLKLGFILLTDEEVLSEIKRRMNEEV